MSGDPIFIRRDTKGNLIEYKHLMSPTETLMNKRILLVTDTIAFTFENSGEARGLIDAISETMLCLDSISNEPIKLIISSPGGSLLGGFALYDAIKAVDSPVWTFGRVCASMATLLLSAGEKGHRYVYPNSFTMLHLPLVVQTGATDTRLHAIRAVEAERRKDRMVDLLLECGIKKTKEQLLEDIDREYWMDARETVEYGLADEVIRGGFLLTDKGI